MDLKSLLSNYYVMHFPGSGKVYYDYKEAASDITIEKSDLITIISPMTPDYIEDSVMVKQLRNSGIDFVNPIDVPKISIPQKIPFILKALKEVETPYCLVMDGGDTCFGGKNLDEEFIEKYKSLGKPVIYNGTTKRFPDIAIEPIGYFLTNGGFSFLNAGVCFGTTEGLIKVYEKAQELRGKIQSRWESEQMYIRHARVKLPDIIGVDSKNILFRVAHEKELDKEID